MGIFKSHTTYNRADKISNFTVHDGRVWIRCPRGLWHHP